MKNSIIETMYNFQEIKVDPMHYSGIFELNGRVGPVNVIDTFTSFPSFKKCFLGVYVDDERHMGIDVFFNNTNNFPNCSDEDGERLWFDVWYHETPIGYAGTKVIFYLNENSVQLCFLKEKRIINDFRFSTLEADFKNEVNELRNNLEPLNFLSNPETENILSQFGGITSVAFQNYGTEIIRIIHKNNSDSIFTMN